MENDNSIFGTLFNSIPLTNEDHIEALLQTMDYNSAIFIIIKAVKYAYEQNAYSLGESEAISKAIRVISGNKKSQE